MLVACAKIPHVAPVSELNWASHNRVPAYYRVKQNESIYAIAFRYDRDYRQVARYNGLRYPYKLRVGQVVYFSRSAKPTQQTPHTIHRSSKPTPIAKKMSASLRAHTASGHWLWPVKGVIKTSFSPSLSKKGIDIAGIKGQGVKASAAGIVAYAGNGLNGYGNLIIIKHNNQLLTAYGNNLRNKVAEGQKVKAGQIIADIGIVDRKFWGVHFEIRKAGKPINPLLFLKP